jgi:predicted amidophosphoribosyltransferase
LTRYAATIRGKTVVLVDDIVTAGSTLAAATALLLQAGAAGVITVTVAATATVRQSNS